MRGMNRRQRRTAAAVAGAVLDFDGVGREALLEVERRLNGLYWKSRSLTAHVPL